jgi:general secretion pathway protein H
MIATRKNGFTLLELLVTLIIMVALLGIAIPQFSHALLNIQLRKSTQEIAALLRQARSSSVTEAQTASLVIDAMERSLRSSPGGQVYRWPADINVTAVGDVTSLMTQDANISFYPDGTASATLLTVSARDSSYTVVVDWLTGRVRVH